MNKYTQHNFSDLAAAASHEWLETNGLGGFSSSTIIGLNTRRYHGLLTGATKPPVGRVVMLSKLEEVLVIDGHRFELSTNQYPGAVHPQGYQYQTGFRLDPFPVFTFEVDGYRLEKTVFMVQGENTVVVEYELRPLSQGPLVVPITLELRPLVAFRDYHSLTHENGAINTLVRLNNGVATIKPYADLPELHFAHDARAIDTKGDWYRSFQYIVEQERGLDLAEDLFNPFSLSFDLSGNAGRARIIASTEPHDVAEGDGLREQEVTRRQTIAGDSVNPLIRALTAAADQFIVARATGNTIIAGYHWFSDWGRDTMIALPGLLLATGRTETAKSVLLEFAQHVDQGMLPNRFPDAGETPEYNTVDATLWFFEAVRALLQYTGDEEFVRQNLYGVLADIIDWHVKGTRYNIQVDEDGLLYSGESGVQLTWMDAKVGDWVITPRPGKPVEIQALWYNALRVMEALATRFGDEPGRTRYAEMADRARDSFGPLFWNDRAGCLYDVVNGAERDGSIRPNQLFAVSLTNSLVTTAQAQQILNVVERELLTPRGLRTLSPNDPRYAGRYLGDPRRRDSVYHQGTVWPWLMGAFITAQVKVFGNAGRERAARWLENFSEHFGQACLGQVSEIFDGDAPHSPRGCVAQAWSVSELLRAAVEDVYVIPRSRLIEKLDADPSMAGK